MTVNTELPLFLANSHVLFQGDSITEGGRWIDSDDLNHDIGQGYPYLIAARHGAYLPNANVRFTNRGISGNTTIDLAARWKVDTLDLKPDVLSILVGINDVGRVSVDDYAATYERLIAGARQALPQVGIVLGEPFTLPVGAKQGNWDEWRLVVQSYQDVAADLATRYRLPYVRYQQAFDEACNRAPAEHWTWDGVHPTYAGHQLMADTWIASFNRRAEITRETL